MPSAERSPLSRLVTCLDYADACDPVQLARLRAQLAEAIVVEESGRLVIARGDQALGIIHPYGSVTLYLPAPSPPLRHRLLELDQNGHVTAAIRRGDDGAFREAWVRTVDGARLGVLPGGATHPLWGASDRLVRRVGAPGASPELLSVSGALDWDAVAAIPPLADPTGLPPGAGTSILNLLAALAADQGTRALRYRGPYPTEQLFWALAESFRFETASADPLSTFLAGAERAWVEGTPREAPLDWIPAPHERRFLDGGVYVQLRDGVEKVSWEGRTYYRADWQGIQRREHRVVRAVTGPDGGQRFVASLVALGRPLKDHLVLDARGNLLASPAPGVGAERTADLPLAAVWREALGGLLAVEATPLLAPAIATVWRALPVVWGPVPLDLVEARGDTLRLSDGLAQAYAADRTAVAAPARRALAHHLVRDVLGLLGPPVRRAAAAWLAAQPPARQAELLEAGRRGDRRTLAAGAAGPLTRLLDALEAGRALPSRPANS